MDPVERRRLGARLVQPIFFEFSANFSFFSGFKRVGAPPKSMTLPRRTLGLLIILSTTVTGVAAPRGEAPEALAFFEKRIRPLLATHCYECHSAEAGKQKGGLLLDSRPGWEKGGDHGPAVVPGDPEGSLLLQVVSYEDGELQMPPDQKLPEEARRYLEEWVRMGAPDPREGDLAEQGGGAMVDAASHWAFQPMTRPAVPRIEGKSRARTPFDRFLEKTQAEAAIEAVDLADAHTLLRRFYVTLTGLPPGPTDIDRFMKEARTRPDQWSRLSDLLMASPRFGEHWGRHWLDVTRFAESSGGGRSLMFKNAWQFRDYTIRAFNQDVPFDVLTMEHVAGDLLFARDPIDTPRQRERLIGSGYLALGPTNYELQDKELLRMEVVDEQIDTVGRTFMGMTLGCARCHDHKFDPISTEEYYALAGIFRSTKTVTPGNVSGYVETTLPGPGYAKRQAFERELEKRQGEVNRMEKRDKKRAKEMKKALDAFKKTAPPALPKAMSVREQEGGEVADCHVRIRGSIRSLGGQVTRGFLASATPEGVSVKPALGPKESGRMALSEWLVQPEHPLTTRVYVNRLWHHVMGVGLVRTVDNFGVTGEAPSHPELLDYLAREFSDFGGWSSKRLIRSLVLSSAFQLGSGSEVAPPQDPENRLVWRAHQRALTAENLRDALLQISGELDHSGGGLTIEKFSAYDNGYQFGDFKRRAVYAPAFRNARLEILKLFDAANPNMVEGRRSRTTLATQALYLMNNPFVLQRAEAFAKRLWNSDLGREQRLERAYLAVLGRPPRGEERAVSRAFLDEAPSDEAWAMLIHGLMASVDFRTLH